MRKSLAGIKSILIVLSFFMTINSLIAKELKREILAFWDSSEIGSHFYSKGPIHKNIEVIFNHYGFKLEYVDVGKSIDLEKLSAEKVQTYAGAISWFHDNDLKEPKKYLKLLNRIVDLKIPLIMIGEFGIFGNQKKGISNFNVLKFLKKLGVGFEDFYSDNPLLFTIKKLKPNEYVEFERELKSEIFQIWGLRNQSKKNEVWAQVEVLNETYPNDAVIVGKWGAIIQKGFGVFEHPMTYRRQWRVNPFKIIEKLFEVTKTPIPDTTTICGKRILYAHIDGDGFINISNIDRKSYSGEIILEKIINKYKVPTTASIVVAEISPSLLGSKRVVKATKKIFENKFVEIASHTYSHPLSWELEPDQEERDIYLDEKEKKTYKGPIVAYKLPKYVMSYEKEIPYSMEYINKYLAPNTKKGKVLLWSGSCRPPLEALKLSESNGFLNMNGGDSRFDNIYNSYTNLSSLYRKIGAYTQVYTSNANENLYTNLWTGPFSGFRDLIITFDKTEKPVRIKPMNIYYHFYSGEHISSLQALEDVYEYALKQDPTLIFGSDHIKNIRSFRDVKIERLNSGFKIIRNGDLRTIRFEGAKDYYPNYQVSENIIGHIHKDNVLYVSLGNQSETYIELTKKKPVGGFVKSCNGFVDEVKIKNKQYFLKGESRVPFKGTLMVNGNKTIEVYSSKPGPFELRGSY